MRDLRLRGQLAEMVDAILQIIKKDISTAAASANILKATESLVFVWSLSVKEELKLAIKDVKLVAAKDALLKITSVEVKIQSIDQKEKLISNHMTRQLRIDLIKKMDAVVNA